VAWILVCGSFVPVAEDNGGRELGRHGVPEATIAFGYKVGVVDLL
jgi:hypothetical protein